MSKLKEETAVNAADSGEFFSKGQHIRGLNNGKHEPDLRTLIIAYGFIIDHLEVT